MTEAICHAVDHGERTVVAAGGDGTVSVVASRLAGTERVLGVLPVGTLNHFAKDLRIPLDLEGAVRTIAEGNVARVDVGVVNGRVFVNNSSLGLYPNIVVEREERRRLGARKWPALFRAALVVVRRMPHLKARMFADGVEIRRDTPFLFVGNNEYRVEGLGLGGRSRLDAGYLWLYVTQRVSRSRLLLLSARALMGGLRAAPEFDAMCVKELWVESRRHRLRVALDGEVVVMAPPLHFRIRPRDLQVLVPSAGPA
jgi:diacylglycerol kinase family enzyme